MKSDDAGSRRFLTDPSQYIVKGFLNMMTMNMYKPFNLVTAKFMCYLERIIIMELYVEWESL